jgi:hypothetical protein
MGNTKSKTYSESDESQKAVHAICINKFPLYQTTNKLSNYDVLAMHCSKSTIKNSYVSC